MLEEEVHGPSISRGKKNIFEAFVQDLLSTSINLLLALYLVYHSYLFNMGPTYMFSRGVETLRINEYLTLKILTHGNIAGFHRLMKYMPPPPLNEKNPPETHSYKCFAELKTLLVEYLLMQNRQEKRRTRRLEKR